MADRVSLREFQAALSQRLSSAREGGGTRALLGFLAGRENWLLDLADSAEIVPVPPLTPVPLAKPWFRGLANIRGSLYTVVDFAGFHGLEPTPVGNEARLLLPHQRFAAGSALLVSRALGLRSPEALRTAERHDARPWVIEELVDGEGTHWNKLAFGELLDHPDFLDVGA